ncbi:MAG: T9SS type A sorting domain-containing protein [Bacteroidales bacterium]
MKNFLLFLLVCFLYYSVSAQTVSWDGANYGGGISDDVGHCITTDSDANIIVGGLFNSTAYFDYLQITSMTYNGGGFIAKYDSLGNILWVRKITGTNTSCVQAITTDQNKNIYFTGHFTETTYIDTFSLTSNGSSDLFIGKYDEYGNLLWIKSAGGIDLDAGMTITCSDSLLFVGGEFRDSVYFDTTLLISNGNSDIFLACMDFNGNYRWIKSEGGTGWDVSRGVTIDEESNIFLTGIFMNTAYFSDTSITSNGSSNAFIAKYDKNGQLQWVRSMNGTSDVWGRSVIISNNEIYVKGHFNGNAQFGTFNLNSQVFSDYFICKLDMSGNFLWAKQIETKLDFMDDFWNHSLESDEQGNIYVTGWFMDSLVYDNFTVQSNGSYDIFVMKIDSDGNLIWALTAGNASGDYSRSIARDDNGNLYITGRFYNTLFFGDSSVTSYGSADVFVAKIREEPVSVVYNEENTSLEITVYPNPATNYVNIGYPPMQFEKVEIVSINGKILRTYNGNQNSLDVSGLASGVYFLKLDAGNMVYVKRVIIQ